MEEDIKSISGNVVDVLNAKVYPGTLKIAGGRIIDIVRENIAYENYILPGFIDSHIHIESSMLIPSEFARVAVLHGTVATVSDPHEIANVLGIDGVKYMLVNGKKSPMKFYFGAPSCVPASTFETSGASIGLKELEELFKLEEIKYLGEVMNFPGVLSGDSILHKKIGIAKKYSKLLDGHAPGLSGKGLKQYINEGINTDHECLTKDEALEKIRLGMKVQIREGSAAKNARDLMAVIEEHYEDCMFCSDDKHPDDLLKGHINDLVKMAINSGIHMMKVLKVACVNPVLHYQLDVGMLQKGDSGDFIVVDNLHDFRILSTHINGQMVAKEGQPLTTKVPSILVNNFKVGKKKVKDFALPQNEGHIHVIEAIDGSLVTNKLNLAPKIVNGYAVSDVERDILKIAVVNRYSETEVAIAFIKNFGLKRGAMASSIAHDSHNVIAVGVTDEDVCRAVNLVIENKGGISAISQEEEMVLPLPIAGIMSNKDYVEVAKKYSAVDTLAKSLGSTLHAPFMTLSFMALLVIPKIKLSDMGLFDSEKFQFTDIVK